MPRVSIIIPTFNCARFVGQAIDSVLKQTYRDYEILVVDDGSTDGTAEVMSHYGEKVRYIYQQNAGVSAARNRALSIAGGEFLAYLDADDVWDSRKLELQIAFLDEHPSCGLVHSDVSVLNEENHVMHFRFNRETQRSVPQGYCAEELLHRCHIQTPTVLERQKCAEKVGGFDERLPVTQDYLHWMMVAFNGWTVGYIDEPLAKYRWRRGSLMSGKRRLLEDQSRMFGVLLPNVLGNQLDEKMQAILQNRVITAERELAYINRLEGDCSMARRRLTSLLLRAPWRMELYLDLIKTYVK